MDGSFVYALVVFLMVILIPHLSKRCAHVSLKQIFGLVSVMAGSIFATATAYHWLLRNVAFLEALIRGLGQALILAALFVLYLRFEADKSKKNDK